MNQKIYTLIKNKNSMKYSIVFFLFFLYSISFLFAQTNDVCTFDLELNGKTYNQVRLVITISDLDDYIVYGKSIDKSNWRFQYPDKIYKRHTGMTLYGMDSTDNNEYKIIVVMPLDVDTLKYDNFTISKNSTVSATLLKSEIFKHQNKTFYNDSFLFSGSDDETMYVMAKALNEGYSLFWRDSLDYHQRIDKYHKLSSKYPDSHYLMSTLYGSLNRYNDKTDISTIYKSFSSQNKGSYFGHKIKQFIEMNFFENLMLPTWDTKQLKSIIKDTTKFSLVVFSASWCGPCHKQIPNLKKIHNDLNEKLDMVYVSIDGPETVDEWKQLMIDEQIPWRSLLGVNDVKGLQNKYYIQSIPLAFLVPPTGKLHRLKLYEEKDIELIYAIVNSK